MGGAAMAFSIVPYVGLMCLVAQYLYPAYESGRTILEKKTDGHALTQWVVFWVICVLYAFIEQYLLFWLLDYIPLYTEIKTLAFVWLVHPTYWGASWLWFAKVKQIHAKFDKEYYDKVLAMLGPLGQEETEHDFKTVSEAMDHFKSNPNDRRVIKLWSDTKKQYFVNSKENPAEFLPVESD